MVTRLSYLVTAVDGPGSVIDDYFANPYVVSTSNPNAVSPADFAAAGNAYLDADFGYFGILPATTEIRFIASKTNNSNGENKAKLTGLTINGTLPAGASSTTTLSVTPMLVTDSGGGVNVSVSMTVTADGSITGVSPSALTVIPGANGGNATFVSGPTGSPTNIGVGVPATFTWVHNLTAGTEPDEVKFSGDATGTGGTFAAATSNGILVTPPLTFTATVDDPASVDVVLNEALFNNDGSLFTHLPPPPQPSLDRLVTSYGKISMAMALWMPANPGFPVCGIMWIDLNGNGVVDGSEVGIANVDVLLYADSNNNGSIDPGEPLVQTVATDISGTCLFSGVANGSYLVQVDETDPDFPTSGLVLVSGGDPITLPPAGGLHDVIVSAAGSSYELADFGYNWPGQIGDTIFYGPNENGTQDLGEAGISGVTINLYNDVNGNGQIDLSEDVVVALTETVADGKYLFEMLPAGNYVVKVDEQTVESAPGSGIFATMLGTSGSSKAVTLTPSGGMVDLDADFGFIEAAEIKGHIFRDINHNCISFQDLLPGNYAVVTTVPAGFHPYADRDGSNPNSIKLTLSVGEDKVGQDFEYRGNAIVTGHIYIDSNGTQDPGEPNIPNLDVVVTDSAGNLQTVETDTNGDWSVSVIPGSTSAKIDENDPQYPTDHTQTEGEDPSEVTAVAEATTPTDNDGFFTCPNTWADWLIKWGSEIPGQTEPYDNPDGDIYSNLCELAPPFNTIAGALPADLAGDPFVVRIHRTLNDQFQPSLFTQSVGMGAATDKVQFLINGEWVTYWLYDHDSNGSTDGIWVLTSDTGHNDPGGTVVPPGRGMFINCIQNAGTLTSLGMVRSNDFARPLCGEADLLSGGYPVDSSANDELSTNTRAMNAGTGFFGSLDSKLADQFYNWRGDLVDGADGYDSYFLLDGGQPIPATTTGPCKAMSRCRISTTSCCSCVIAA